MLWPLFAVLLGALSQARGAARAWTPDMYPNPMVDIGSCGRGVKSAICDPDGVLTRAGANTVEGEILAVRAGEEPYTRVPCGDEGAQGFQVAVAVMRHFEGGDGDGAAQGAAAFAQALHDAWGVGSAACNNGALILLSMGDRQLYISTGAAAARRLAPDALASIMGRMKPALRAGQPDQALQEGVVALGLALAGHALPPAGEDAGGGALMFGFFASVVAAIFGWGWWSNCRTRRRFKSCQDALSRIKADQQRLRRHEYAATSCPIW